MSTKVKAVVWLHLIRLYRYRLSFLGLVLSNIMWVLMALLGVLLFISPEQFNEATKAAFWSIVGWIFLADFSNLVGGWTNFFISIHMVEEHILRNTSPFLALLGRGITALIVTVASSAAMGLVFGSLFSVDILWLSNPALFLVAALLLVVEALSYGLIIASLAMRTTISYNFLEIASFVLVGLFIVPLDSIPPETRTVFLAVPFVAPVHLMKVAAGVSSGYLLESLAISLLEALIFVVLTVHSAVKTMKYVMKQGVKAVGAW